MKNCLRKVGNMIAIFTVMIDPFFHGIPAVHVPLRIRQPLLMSLQIMMMTPSLIPWSMLLRTSLSAQVERLLFSDLQFRLEVKT